MNVVLCLHAAATTIVVVAVAVPAPALVAADERRSNLVLVPTILLVENITVIVDMINDVSASATI